ncbi:MAG: hypothetical protein NTZ77_05275, partial [Caldiserica bacterium]|nr:hypothetical protein [Caldisericota bacterium]
DCRQQVFHFKESIRFTCDVCFNVFIHVHHVDPSTLRMNVNQLLSIEPKRTLVKPPKTASLPADVGFVSKDGRTGKPRSSRNLDVALQQPMPLLDALRTRHHSSGPHQWSFPDD